MGVIEGVLTRPRSNRKSPGLRSYDRKSEIELFGNVAMLGSIGWSNPGGHISGPGGRGSLAFVGGCL